MSFQEKLEAAKEKAALRDFDVTITESLKMTVTVRATDELNARQIVSEAWDNGEYVLDYDHFAGADFEATPTKHIQVRGEAR